jgi:hypothetical protein
MTKKHVISAFIYVAVFLAASSTISLSQTNKIKPKPRPIKEPPAKKKLFEEEGKTNFQFGGGIMSSVVYLSRNVNDKNDARGWTVMGSYGGNKLFRVSAQYTQYFPINIAPTWYNVKANTIESNLEWMVYFKNKKSILYPLVGLSYNTFKGYFTGFNDYLNLKSVYKTNTTVSSRWLGLNVGTGFEHAFGPVVLFIDYKMRVGKMEERFSFTIMDVCYSGGVRLKLWIPTLKKLRLGLKDKYHWF